MNRQIDSLGALLALCATLASCGGSVASEADSGTSKATVDVTVVDPKGLAPQAKHQLLALFAGGCPTDEDLAFGKIAAAESIQKIPQLDKPFDVSGLEMKKIAFVGILRRDDCAVLGFGCTPADLTIHKYILIQVDPVTPPVAACTGGQTCVDGQCKP